MTILRKLAVCCATGLALVSTACGNQGSAPKHSSTVVSSGGLAIDGEHAAAQQGQVATRLPADVMNGCVANYWVGLKKKNFTLRDLVEELSRRPDIKVSVEEGEAPDTYIVRVSRYDSLKREQVEVSWEFRPGEQSWNRIPCDTGRLLVLSRAWEEQGGVGYPGTTSIDDIVENSAKARADQATEDQQDSNTAETSDAEAANSTVQDDADSQLSNHSD